MQGPDSGRGDTSTTELYNVADHGHALKVRQSLICLSTAGALHHGMLHDPVFYATV